MDLGFFPWFPHESFMHKLCFLKMLCLGADFQSSCNIDLRELLGRDGNSQFCQEKKLKITENMFNIAWVVDLFLMKHHISRENTGNIVNIGYCLSENKSNTS